MLDGSSPLLRKDLLITVENDKWLELYQILFHFVMLFCRYDLSANTGQCREGLGHGGKDQNKCG